MNATVKRVGYLAVDEVDRWFVTLVIRASFVA
jgi:hypothetical protein